MHSLEHTKSVKIAGREYLYFVTARKTPKGKPILVRLPARNDPSFGATYAGHLAGLTRSVEAVVMVPALVRMYEMSPKYRKLAEGSQRLYGIYLRKFAEDFTPAPADEITRRDIMHAAEQMKPGAANMYVKTVNALYAWGRRWEKVTVDPCADIDMNELGEHEPWSGEALQAGLEATDPLVKLAVHLMLYTAQRIGDVCRMRWTDIAGDRILVTQEKTGRPLRIQIHANLAAELRKLPRSFEAILIRRGCVVPPSTLRPRLQRYMAAQGFKVKPHGLRKNAVIALLEAGCSMAETSAISGQSLQMVEHYARHRNQAALGDAAILKWERGRNGNEQS